MRSLCGFVCCAENLVIGRHDVFDLARGLNLKQRDEVYQHSGVRQELGGASQRSQSMASSNGLFEHGSGLHLLRRWQWRQVLVGPIRMVPRVHNLDTKERGVEILPVVNHWHLRHNSVAGMKSMPATLWCRFEVIDHQIPY